MIKLIITFEEHDYKNNFPERLRQAIGGSGTIERVDIDPRGHLVGHTITKARPMTAEELMLLDWHPSAYDLTVALDLDSGATLFASSDVEGNAPGVFYEYSNGEVYVIAQMEGEGS